MQSVGMENTTEAFSSTFLNVLPTIILQRKLSTTNSIKLGYTSRVQRPNIELLNPYPIISDPRYLSFGNPNLSAVRNHKFDLDYSSFKKANIVIGTSYTLTNNAIQSVTEIGTDSISRTTYGNTGIRHQIGLNTNVSKSFGKKFMLSLSGNLNYVLLKGSLGSEYFENDGVLGFAYMFMNYKFNDGWNAQFFSGYSGQMVRLQGTTNGFFFHAFSCNKSYLNDRLTFTLNVANPFVNSVTINSTISSIYFLQEYHREQVIRDINFAVSYRFDKRGRSTKRIKKINNEDEVADY
ncbi:Outer membrane protein beta-barrel family protein [Parapedobacter luteus]|uniref:Outer membrane protein beta-barrel family protein n=2 Tax=Parapedobacter luteus TaxID=623280 RepID=A0A1T5FM71_9SPHI|nr:Outer membrane protein beta-barrel family protein [Parapedobacter luteus]